MNRPELRKILELYTRIDAKVRESTCGYGVDVDAINACSRTAPRFVLEFTDLVPPMQQDASGADLTDPTAARSIWRDAGSVVGHEHAVVAVNVRQTRSIGRR